ncbi:MAG TPA: hypothetical protein DG761_08480 [Gammaproteobacteria bacterium]|jgi:hypothetical protein|nr:hypothetical protein [Acidiferrobacteraceae bacterium]MDP6398108.1 hypothetical protein [Arenicellales bacterium]HCX88049.1 hypothetical protein [Gammaproteobacteria bacterium]MDP6550821.1 hypothetical protein [Arenicellales bacterium]MDP6792242.1 hypothetical protein [Arenicellales bacterium]|tara:strand:- start:805 stop:1122 length:318 start_codon:yes stop_codon:yes gene_type:complete
MDGTAKKRRLTAALAAVLAIAATASPRWVSGETVGVYGLTQAGWQIVKQIEKQEIRSGVSPYASLQRVVSITEYHLEKEGRIMVCWVSYDSQQDIQEERCEEPQA